MTRHHPHKQTPPLTPLRRVWLLFALTGLGCCVGVLALLYGAAAYVKLPGLALFQSYFQHPALLGLNLLPPVLLIWLFYFLTRRGWCAFLGSFLPCIIVAMVNYFKIRLRSDPFLAADLRLVSEAGGIVGNYSLDVDWLTWLTLGALVAGLLFSALLIPKWPRRGWVRAFAAASCAALCAVSCASLFTDQDLYQATDNSEYINPWSDVEVFVSKGCLYPFLYSMRDMFPAPPPGYDAQAAQAMLAEFTDEDIPADKQVSVMGIMLEAFCDLTDFDFMASQPAVAQVYEPWHELAQQGVSGRLLTNIFAGGTVDSEWGFLSGYSQHDDFRRDTDSYVWYLRDQGYQTFFSHPGYSWFYNRQNVNGYLGFQDSWFTENHYGDLVDPTSAIYHSDDILTDELFAQLKERVADGPCFSFSVSYQNHGPYEWAAPANTEYVTPEGSGLDQESCNIWNHYLSGVGETIAAMNKLTQDLDSLDEPVVMVLFGDHKPWGGNGNSAYAAMGLTFDLGTLQGFYDYYATPYLIWANAAAKEILGDDFTGDGGDFSPCFLMPKVFDLCGWTGPAFMQLARQVREVTPLVHERGLYLYDGQITDALPQEQQDFVTRFLWAEYWRETQGLSAK